MCHRPTVGRIWAQRRTLGLGVTGTAPLWSLVVLLRAHGDHVRIIAPLGQQILPTENRRILIDHCHIRRTPWSAAGGAPTAGRIPMALPRAARLLQHVVRAPMLIAMPECAPAAMALPGAFAKLLNVLVSEAHCVLQAQRELRPRCPLGRSNRAPRLDPRRRI